MPELNSLSDLLLKHGITVVVLLVVLGAFLWGVYYVMTKFGPKLLAEAREDAKVERQRADEARTDYLKSTADRDALFMMNLEKLDKSNRDNNHEHTEILSRLAERLESLVESMDAGACRYIPVIDPSQLPNPRQRRTPP